jgi:hypothetical protein
MLHRTLLITAFASLPWAVACTQSEDDACGKGTVYRDGGCHPATAGTSSTSAGTTSSSDGGAGADAGGAPQAGAPGATDPNFGVPCETADECSGSTNYCVPASPFDSAYCSVQDCDPAAPEVCPAGWTCTDLSRFVAGSPWACTRPFD